MNLPLTVFTLLYDHTKFGLNHSISMTEIMVKDLYVRLCDLISMPKFGN